MIQQRYAFTLHTTLQNGIQSLIECRDSPNVLFKAERFQSNITRRGIIEIQLLQAGTRLIAKNCDLVDVIIASHDRLLVESLIRPRLDYLYLRAMYTGKKIKGSPLIFQFVLSAFGPAVPSEP